MSQSKKILIFSTAYYPFVGGAEVAIKEITDRVLGGQKNVDDVQFDLITAKINKNLPKFERVFNINVYRVGFGFKTLDKLLLPFLGAVKVCVLHKKNNYRAFWCVMTSFASLAGYIFNTFRFGKKVPIILTLQEGDSEEHLQKRWFGLLDISWKLALRNTDALVVISKYLEQRAKRYGYYKKIEIIPNGVDISKFELKSVNFELKQKMRAELDVKKDDVLLVTASRLVKKNGVGDVVKALNLLPQNIKFLIMGEGKLEDQLKKLTKDLSLKDRVIFKGFLSQEEVFKYYKISEIFIRPSLSEGFGNSFIEAMATKLPVIATPVGGIVDFLKDGETGYFCEVENPKSIAETVKKVLTDNNKNKIIENAFKMTKERYDWDLIAKKMISVFNKF